jgi:trk system potassium uptake protein TrkH
MKTIFIESEKLGRLWNRMNALQLLAIGFAVIILVGAGLLCLPISNKGGGTIPFINALFTSTSATCVTGLVVYDTFIQFTIFGQVVILTLIQIGGLGFMTIAVLFSMILGKRIGLKERSYLKESVSAFQLGGVVRLSKRILIVTAVVESMGALLLSIRFVPMLGFWRGVWYSIFHAVSAFCNAGFDLFGFIEPYGSLVPFVGDALVSGTIAGLILIGGLGFIVWNDMIEHGLHFSKYQLHSRVIIVISPVPLFHLLLFAFCHLTHSFISLRSMHARCSFASSLLFHAHSLPGHSLP